MTETIKAESLASVKRERAPRAARKKSAKSITGQNSAAQKANAHKRWNAVPAAERSENSREMARQRWATSEQMDVATKQYFETEDLDVAMVSYDQMRKTFEMAGKILDGRFQAERQADEKCSNPACGKKFSRDIPWYYRNSIRNPITGAAYNEFACSQACMIAIKGVGTQKRSGGPTNP